MKGSLRVQQVGGSTVLLVFSLELLPVNLQTDANPMLTAQTCSDVMMNEAGAVMEEQRWCIIGFVTCVMHRRSRTVGHRACQLFCANSQTSTRVPFAPPSSSLVQFVSFSPKKSVFL